MYGAEGLCLIWSINNAFKKVILDPKVIIDQIKQIDRLDKAKPLKYFIGKDGIDFKTFKKLIKDVYKIQLTKVKKYSNKGKYLLTYDFGSYYHSVAMVDGEVIDSRKKNEITSTDTGKPLVDVYKITKF
jgi:hypothetical protein